jgi:hypothetical protein
MNDATPDMEEEYIQDRLSRTMREISSNVPWTHNLPDTRNPISTFPVCTTSPKIHAGYGIGNLLLVYHQVPPDAYYTNQDRPQCQYGIRPLVMRGDLDRSQEAEAVPTRMQCGRAFEDYGNERWRRRPCSTQFTKGYRARPWLLSPRDRFSPVVQLSVRAAVKFS